MSDEAATTQRKRYIVQISFYLPESGPIQVFATDEAHARELVPKMVPHLKDVVIHDVFLAESIETHEPPQTAPATPTIN